GWREIVAVRLDDRAYEGRRLARFESAVGVPLNGRKLLDVGCGTGGFSLLAAEAGADVWSVDESPEAVALTAARTAPERAMVATAESLPFEDASFDLIYCYSTLEHLADAGRAVGEMVRLLRPGGRLYLHSPDRRGCLDRKSTRLNSSHQIISYAVVCLKKRKNSTHDYSTVQG